MIRSCGVRTFSSLSLTVTRLKSIQAEVGALEHGAPSYRSVAPGGVLVDAGHLDVEALEPAALQRPEFDQLLHLDRHPRPGRESRPGWAVATGAGPPASVPSRTLAREARTAHVTTARDRTIQTFRRMGYLLPELGPNRSPCRIRPGRAIAPEDRPGEPYQQSPRPPDQPPESRPATASRPEGRPGRCEKWADVTMIPRPRDSCGLRKSVPRSQAARVHWPKASLPRGGAMRRILLRAREFRTMRTVPTASRRGRRPAYTGWSVEAILERSLLQGHSASGRHRRSCSCLKIWRSRSCSSPTHSRGGPSGVAAPCIGIPPRGCR